MVIESGSRVSGSKGVEAFEVHGLCWRWQLERGMVEEGE